MGLDIIAHLLALLQAPGVSARIEKLKELISTEFSEVRARIEKGSAPLEFYAGIGSQVVYRIGADENLPLVTKDGEKGRACSRGFTQFYFKDGFCTR